MKQKSFSKDKCNQIEFRTKKSGKIFMEIKATIINIITGYAQQSKKTEKKM